MEPIFEIESDSLFSLQTRRVEHVVVRVRLVEERAPSLAAFGGAFGVVDLGVGHLQAGEARAGIRAQHHHGRGGACARKQCRRRRQQRDAPPGCAA